MSYNKDDYITFYPTGPDTKEEHAEESMEKIMKFEIVVNRKDKDLIDIIREVIDDSDVGTATIKVDRNVVRIKVKAKWQD